VVSVEIAQRSLDVVLVLWCGFVLLLLELCVADVSFAELAPVLWLRWLLAGGEAIGQGVMLTVDFQYSDMAVV